MISLTQDSFDEKIEKNKKEETQTNKKRKTIEEDENNESESGEVDIIRVIKNEEEKEQISENEDQTKENNEKFVSSLIEKKISEQKKKEKNLENINTVSSKKIGYPNALNKPKNDKIPLPSSNKKPKKTDPLFSQSFGGKKERKNSSVDLPFDNELDHLLNDTVIPSSFHINTFNKILKDPSPSKPNSYKGSKSKLKKKETILQENEEDEPFVQANPPKKN